MFKEIKLKLDNVSRDITATQKYSLAPFPVNVIWPRMSKILTYKNFLQMLYSLGVFFSVLKIETKPHSNVILFVCIIPSEIY